MRIRILKAFPGAPAVGEFLTVEDEALAKQYVAIGYAEEAPEADAADPVAQLKGLVGDIAKAVRSELAAETKAGSKGPRIDAGESELDRKKSFGHQLQLIGVAGNREATSRQVEDAHVTLKNLYGSEFRAWSSDDHKAANVQTKASGTQVESSGITGGFGVYPEYSTELYKLAIEESFFASRAKRRPMQSNTYQYPRLNQTSSRVSGSTGYLGGIVLYWQKEAQALTQTGALLEQGELKAHKLQGYTQISIETLADNSVALESEITDLVREGVGWFIDYACLVGDGVDKPMGVANAAATLGSTITRTTSNLVKYADLVAMDAMLFPRSSGSAFWIFNQTVKPQIWNMQDGSSRLILQPYAASSATPNMPSKILEHPFIFTEKTPVLGSAGDVMLVDPQGYMIGDRMGLEIAASNAPGFLTGLMTYRFISRVAGQPILPAAYTMADGTNKLSHFVKLPA